MSNTAPPESSQLDHSSKHRGTADQESFGADTPHRFACIIASANPDLPVISNTCNNGQVDIKHTKYATAQQEARDGLWLITLNTYETIREHLKKHHSCDCPRAENQERIDICRHLGHLTVAQLAAVKGIRRRHYSPDEHWNAIFRYLYPEISPIPAPRLRSVHSIIAFARHLNPTSKYKLTAAFGKAGFQLTPEEVDRFLSLTPIFLDLVCRDAAASIADIEQRPDLDAEEIEHLTPTRTLAAFEERLDTSYNGAITEAGQLTPSPFQGPGLVDQTHVRSQEPVIERGMDMIDILSWRPSARSIFM